MKRIRDFDMLKMVQSLEGKGQVEFYRGRALGLWLAFFLRKERVHQGCLDGSDALVKSFVPVVAFDNAYDAPEP